MTTVQLLVETLGSYCQSPCPGLLWDLASLQSNGHWRDFLLRGNAEWETGHSSPSSGKVKNIWNFISVPFTPSWEGAWSILKLAIGMLVDTFYESSI